MSYAIFQPMTARVVQATMNLAQAAATYDLLTATGSVLLIGANVNCTVVGATWTSVTIQTNNTTAFVLMDATQGARANFTADKNVALTWTEVAKAMLVSGKKIQYTIAGSTGTGTALFTAIYYPITVGAVLG